MLPITHDSVGFIILITSCLTSNYLTFLLSSKWISLHPALSESPVETSDKSDVPTTPYLSARPTAAASSAKWCSMWHLQHFFDTQSKFLPCSVVNASAFQQTDNTKEGLYGWKCYSQCKERNYEPMNVILGYLFQRGLIEILTTDREHYHHISATHHAHSSNRHPSSFSRPLWWLWSMKSYSSWFSCGSVLPGSQCCLMQAPPPRCIGGDR
jgi:hypothetical protein